MGISPGQDAQCPACERIFPVYALPDDPESTRCPHCQAVHRIAALPLAFRPRSVATTLADLENPDFAYDSRGQPVDVVGNNDIDPIMALSSFADETPRGLGFETTPNGWRLSVPHYSTSRLLKALGGILGPGVMLFAFMQFNNASSSMLNRRFSFGSFDLIFGAVILLTVIPALWNLLNTLLARTYMESDGEQIIIREGLWPLPQTHSFAWSEVQRVRAVDTTLKEERRDSDGDRYTVNVRHSFLQLLGPSRQVAFARNVYGANFWELRDFLQGELNRRSRRDRHATGSIKTSEMNRPSR